MEYRDLGKTGLRVSRIGFGGEHVTDADFATTEAVMRTAMEAGVNIMDGVRPVLIIQNDVGNCYSPTVIVAAITSRPNKHWIPTHIELGNHVRGLHNDSVILLEQVRTIDRIRLRGYVGSLSGAMMRKVDEAILVSFGVTVQRRT